MQFTYYTEKTVAQCMLALNERIQGSSRAGLSGWVEKSGLFSLSVSSKVLNRFHRTTRLQAKAERQGSVTIIKGYVSDGVAPRQQAIILGGLALAGALMMVAGMMLPGLVTIAGAMLLYIPLSGDYQNSRALTAEVQRTLKAKTTPPIVVKKVAVRKPTPAKKPTPRPTGAKKPTGSTANKQPQL